VTIKLKLRYRREGRVDKTGKRAYEATDGRTSQSRPSSPFRGAVGSSKRTGLNDRAKVCRIGDTTIPDRGCLITRKAGAGQIETRPWEGGRAKVVCAVKTLKKVIERICWSGRRVRRETAIPLPLKPAKLLTPSRCQRGIDIVWNRSDTVDARRGGIGVGAAEARTKDLDNAVP